MTKFKNCPFCNCILMYNKFHITLAQCSNKNCQYKFSQDDLANSINFFIKSYYCRIYFWRPFYDEIKYYKCISNNGLRTFELIKTVKLFTIYNFNELFNKINLLITFI